MAEFVSVSVTDAVATLWLARPPMNAANLQLLREIGSAAVAVSADPTVSAVVLYGGEKVFCGGEDRAEQAQPQSERALEDRRAALAAVAAIGKPTVAAISCYALGVGLELALAADRRIVGDNVKLGWPGGGSDVSARLTALVGPGQAADLVFTGRFVDAAAAASMRLVEQVVAPDDVYTAALTWARRCAARVGAIDVRAQLADGPG